MATSEQTISRQGNTSTLPASGVPDEAGVAVASPAVEAAPAEGPMATNRPLYAEFYGLQESPFELTPDPRFLFLTPRQREALSNLRYALSTSKGFTLLVGDAGTGKTTLVRAALEEMGDSPSRYVFVSNPTLGRAEFYEFLASEFNLSDAARTSKTRFLAELRADVEARFEAGGLTGLIFDEAQSMPYELLEEVRLLGNIETTRTKLLNIVLSGQPELADRLNEASLRQLKQRIALRCELKALTLDETASYISGRIRIAGGSPQGVFTRQTVIAIHEASTGIPRTINVLCDNALIGGFAAQAKPITVEIVEDVCRDFDMRGAAAPADEAPPVAAPTLSERGTPAATPALPERQAGRSMFGSVTPERKRRFTFFS